MGFISGMSLCRHVAEQRIAAYPALGVCKGDDAVGMPQLIPRR